MNLTTPFDLQSLQVNESLAPAEIPSITTPNNLIQNFKYELWYAYIFRKEQKEYRNFLFIVILFKEVSDDSLTFLIKLIVLILVCLIQVVELFF
jgi:hypothetical protein